MLQKRLKEKGLFGDLRRPDGSKQGLNKLGSKSFTEQLLIADRASLRPAAIGITAIVTRMESNWQHLRPRDAPVPGANLLYLPTTHLH